MRSDITKSNLDSFKEALADGTEKFFDLENSKKKAHLTKWKATENLDRYLLDFEANFTRRGGKVIWANDAEEAREEIRRILANQETKAIVKTTSASCEEIGLFDFLHDKGFDPAETDTLAFIKRLFPKESSTWTFPPSLVNLSAIIQQFHEKFQTPIDSKPEQLIEKVNQLIREKLNQAEIGIAGVDFLIADSGSIGLTENEGNAMLLSSFSKIQIFIAGIDKIVPSVQDMDLFWPLLASYTNGQSPAVYNSILSGPRQAGEVDGPEAMYVILLDNGRSNLLAKKEQRQGLYCIQCSACRYIYPVNSGGGTLMDDNVHPGPIGSMVAPHMNTTKDLSHLSFASPLDGQASVICPVRIEIDKMLLLNRKEAVEQNLVRKSEKRFWGGFAYLFLRRRLLDFFGHKTKNFLFQHLLKKSWGKERSLPRVAKKSFAQQWQDQEKKKNQ
ncbi:LUD domain-containing protein [Sphingobacterium griseoflavum]|nr:LUD domain-containing protein [Sphingobacterium griseoflavum]